MTWTRPLMSRPSFHDESRSWCSSGESSGANGLLGKRRWLTRGLKRCRSWMDSAEVQYFTVELGDSEHMDVGKRSVMTGHAERKRCKSRPGAMRMSNTESEGPSESSGCKKKRQAPTIGRRAPCTPDDRGVGVRVLALGIIPRDTRKLQRTVLGMSHMDVDSPPIAPAIEAKERPRKAQANLKPAN